MKSTLFALPLLWMLFAAEALAGVAGWTEAAAVLALEASDQGRFTVKLAVDKNTSGCRNPNWFYVDYGGTGSELMYQTLLESTRNERKVQVYVTGGCDLNGYSGVSAVRILP